MVVFRKLAIVFIFACYGCDSSNVDVSEKKIAEKTSKQNFSAALVLDGTALNQTFQRFFTLDREVFDPRQQRNLGGIKYDGKDATLRNGRRYREVDQNYIKTLRTVLLQLCQDKTEQEMQAVASTQAGDSFVQHAIVKRQGLPEEKDINDIMTAMFGYENSAGNHYGAAEYASLMQDNLSTVQVDSEVYHSKLQANYVLLCMAIGQDARVYLR